MIASRGVRAVSLLTAVVIGLSGLSGCGAPPAPPAIDPQDAARAFAELDGTPAAPAPEPVLRRPPSVVTPRARPVARPDWVSGAPADPLRYHGVASAPLTDDGDATMEQARRQALALAQADLAAQYSVTVVSEVRSVIREWSDDSDRGARGGPSEVSSDYSCEVRTLTRQQLQDIEQEEWVGDRRLWVHVSSDRNQLRVALERDLQNARQIAAQHLDAGLDEERRGNPAEAIKAYVRALTAIRLFLGAPVTYPGGAALLAPEIEHRLGRLLGQLTLAAEGSTTRRGRPGEPLAPPLSVRARLGADPVPGLPLRFEFIRGAGQVQAEVQTGAEGQAASTVYRVDTADAANAISARVDLERMTGLGTEALVGLRSTFERLGGAPVVFLVATAGGRVYLQMGEPRAAEGDLDAYFATLLKDTLADSAAVTFVGSSEAADLIIRGSVTSRPITRIDDVSFCYADADVSLVDARSGVELRRARVDRVKGYQRTDDEARRVALLNAAHQVASILVPCLPHAEANQR